MQCSHERSVFGVKHENAVFTVKPLYPEQSVRFATPVPDSLGSKAYFQNPAPMLCKFVLF